MGRRHIHQHHYYNHAPPTPNADKGDGSFFPFVIVAAILGGFYYGIQCATHAFKTWIRKVIKEEE